MTLLTSMTHTPRHKLLRRLITGAVLGTSLFCSSAYAQVASGQVNILGNIEKRANGVLSLMAYSVVPDLTTSSLSITDASSGNPDLSMSQLGGGFTVSDSVPLYLEGSIAYSRYDPRFVATNGQEQRDLPVKWNTFAGTVGIGWDFPLFDELKLRPIANFSLGRVESDVSLASWFVGQKLDRQFNFLDGGYMNAYGYGGSLMLDYEHYRENYEIDVELRYTNIMLRNFDSSNGFIKAHSDAEALNLWARWRAPTGLHMLDRPLRYVLEVSHSEFLGDQRGILGFDNLSTLGAGLELDSSKYPVIITRTRLLARYVFGENVSGWSLGLAVSF